MKLYDVRTLSALVKPGIADLNDAFRVTAGIAPVKGNNRVVMTGQVASLSPETLETLFRKVRAFNDFTEDNDPYGEHDFGAFDHDGGTFFWKIDYYDKDLEFGSDDPADPEKTARVLTLMFASEY